MESPTERNYKKLLGIFAVIFAINMAFAIGLAFLEVMTDNEARTATVANILNTNNTKTTSRLADKPNIILILGDDWGWPYYGFMGHPFIKTPNLDKLASEGVTFVNGTVAAAHCRPSLQSLMTGLNQRDISFRGSAVNFEKHKPFMQRLTEEGYATLHTGKWWEGNLDNIFTDKEARASSWQSIGRNTMDPLWNFMHKYAIDPAPENRKPFFIWFAPLMPHLNFTPPQEYRDLYKGIDFSTLPKDQMREIFNGQGYYGMMTWLDTRIGELVKFLEDNNLRENTLLVYLSDNGFGLDTSKLHFTENGLRTPIILNYLGKIPPTGLKNSLVHEIDIYPTVMNYAGVSGTQFPDALDMRQFVESGSSGPWRKYIFGNWFANGQISARTEQYKLYMNDAGVTKPSGLQAVKLFDLSADPYENENLIFTVQGRKQYDSITEELLLKAKDWWFGRVNPPLE